MYIPLCFASSIFIIRQLEDLQPEVLDICRTRSLVIDGIIRTKIIFCLRKLVSTVWLINTARGAAPMTHLLEEGYQGHEEFASTGLMGFNVETKLGSIVRTWRKVRTRIVRHSRLDVHGTYTSRPLLGPLCVIPRHVAEKARQP